MKRMMILTIALTTLISVPAYAYSDDSIRLGKESGVYVGDYDLDEVMRRQEALKSGQATNNTPNTSNGQNKANRRIKGGVDEYRVVNGGGQNSVKITDTTDGLHIYSNDYNNPSSYGSKQSTDEFRVFGSDTPANDGHDESTWGELHINRNYLQNVYHPSDRGNRIDGFDEFRYADELN